MVVSVTLAETTRLLAGGSETSGFTVLSSKSAFMVWWQIWDGTNLMDRVDNPADPGVPTDSFVLRIDEDDFKVLVGRILVDPVRVEDSEIGTSTSYTFFGGGSKGALVLELVDTLVCRFAWLRSV